jgi:hypothetical protein
VSGSYHQTCNKCGAHIIMAQAPHGRYVALEPGGGRHVHRSFDLAETFNPTSSLERLRSPLTYWTRCWIDGCGAGVWYHTNGNGDCVLLDSLVARPWKVHDCWQRHREQRNRTLRAIEEALKDVAFNGSTYSLSCEDVRPDPREQRISACGPILPRSYTEASRHDVSCLERSAVVDRWTVVAMFDEASRLRCRFLVPQKIAERLSPYMVIHVTGRWMLCRDEPLLIAERVSVRMYPSNEVETIRIVRLSKPRCAYCGATIRKSDRWGITSSRHIECLTCATLRGEENSSDFLRHVRKIAIHRLRMSK